MNKTLEQFESETKSLACYGDRIVGKHYFDRVLALIDLIRKKDEIISQYRDIAERKQQIANRQLKTYYVTSQDIVHAMDTALALTEQLK